MFKESVTLGCLSEKKNKKLRWKEKKKKKKLNQASLVSG